MRLPLLLALILPLQAAAASGPFDVEVAVADRSEATRLGAIRDALAQLLFRLSGQQGLAADPAVRLALAQQERLLRGFAYVDGEAAAAVGPEPQLALRASFVAEEILRLLDELRAPIWFGPRPTVLLLIEEEAPEGTRGLVHDEHPLAPRFRRAARRLGYPLVFPLADPVEERLIAEALADRQGSRRLAERYGVRVILAGRLRPFGELIAAEWLLWQADRAASHAERADASQLAESVMDRLHLWLAARYAVPAAERLPEVFPLAVAGIRGAADYLALMALLRNHGLLTAVRPERAEGDRLSLTLASRVRRARAIELLGLDPRLERDPRPGPQLPPESQLLWLP
jgi:hypothetical protein